MDAPDPALPPTPLDPAAAQARLIRRRLLERVADADDTHLTITADSGAWHPFIDGVTIKVLHKQDGMLSYLLRLAPGARLPPHRHPCDEECVVLEGHLCIGSHITIGAGSYHRAHGGALHATVTAPTGATIFLRGAVPEADHVLG